MIILLSPAKTLDFDQVAINECTEPRLLADSETLVKQLKKKSVKAIRELMSVSEKLAELNVERYKSFKTPFTNDNSKPAVLTFSGDVYTGLQASSFDQKDLKFAQTHLRILSGLYGVLRPLDLMQAYRLEMGTSLKTSKGKNLYEFWDRKITDLINEDLQEAKSDIVLNLASKEYFGCIDTKLIHGTVIDVDFKENREGKFKVISFNAKKARGAMAHKIVKHRITDPKKLKRYSIDGYKYNKDLSHETHLVFTK